MSLSIRAAVVACVVMASSVSGVSAQQAIREGGLASIKAMTCTFPTSVVANWNAEGVPEPRIRPTGTLTIKITEIEAADGSAVVGGHDVNVQVYGWNMHFLEAGAGGRMGVTTVFAQNSKDGKLKAVHSRTDYLPIDLPGFKSQPEVAQYYGDCVVE